MQSLLEKIKFPPSDLNDWINVASQELAEANPISKLTQTKAGLEIKPFYEAADVSRNELLLRSRETKWLNVPKISVSNAKTANVSALNHLNFGADGVLFDLRSIVSAEELLKNIELQHCHIFFLADGNLGADFFHSFSSLTSKRKTYQAAGCLYGVEPVNFSTDSVNGFRSNGIIVGENEDSSAQVASAFQSAADRVDLLTNSGCPVSQALDALAFLWPVKTDFFISVSEMRAMQMLWPLFLSAYRLENNPIFIHAYSKSWTKESFQPHANLLKQTASALSAVFGNCNALTSEAESEDSAMMSRIARNISSIISDESHVAKVSDPLAGSYFVETLTNQLAEKSWKKFIEKL